MKVSINKLDSIFKKKSRMKITEILEYLSKIKNIFTFQNILIQVLACWVQ
jgi:hypothetical protein